MHSLSVVLCFLIFIDSSFGITLNPEVAEVTKLRGTVTQLRPGAWEANKLHLGDRLKEDTSVLTGKKSFVSIKFIDGSRINLGPSSKFVITKMDSKDGGIVSLLKGKMRTQVKKDKGATKNKLFIRTQNAAMGVRGTEFQTIYNPENKVTSLLTYEGEVAMVKVNHEGVAKKVEQRLKRISRTEVEVEDTPELPETDVQEMNKLLEQKETVIVKGGQYSGTVAKLEKVSKPVKVSPIQLGVLYQNDEFKERKGGKIRRASLSNLDKQNLNLKQIEQEVPPEGFFNAKTGDYAPKAGGVIDLDTGLYIPPGKNSDFDTKRGIYVAKEIGDVDNETGQYIPPKGLILDAKKGFIVKKKANDPNLLAQATQLNQVAATKLIIDDGKDEIDAPIRIYTVKERFAKDSIYLNIRGFDQSIASQNSSLSSNNRNLDEGGSGFFLNWNHGSSSRFQLYTGLGFDVIDFGNIAGLSQETDKVGRGEIGLRYNLSSRWNVLGGVAIDEDFFIVTTTSNNVTTESIAKATLTRLTLGLEGNLILAAGERFSLDTELRAFFNPSKDTAGFKVESGFGFEAKLLASYWVTSRFQVRFGPWHEVYNRDLTGISTAYSAEGEQDQTGFQLDLGYLF